jgi:hypothetical protein
MRNTLTGGTHNCQDQFHALCPIVPLDLKSDRLPSRSTVTTTVTVRSWRSGREGTQPCKARATIRDLQLLLQLHAS